jgi:16S rRNA (guanine527-N7)-methyltransferase
LSTTPNTQEVSPNWRIKDWFPDLDEKTHQHLKTYFLELIKFNKVVNLISAKTVPHADAIHFADSILASRAIREKVNKSVPLYDLGSGNGFPGLVYAILYPDQKVTLIDSDERKCEFLKHVSEALPILNVTVLNKKIEMLPNSSLDQAICRGYAPLPRALLTMRKILKSKGQIFHLKADEWSMEVSQIPTQLCSAWQPALDSEYKLPIGDIKLYVVRTVRID